LNKPIRLLRKVNEYRSLLYWYFRIQASGLFDRNWYLTQNPGVARANVNPLLHYMVYGGLEGRDPGPDFSSRWYLDTYEDARTSGINPLIHYLKYGRKEGRTGKAPYKCPVCNTAVNEFLPLAPYYTENLKKHGWPYKPEQGETSKSSMRSSLAPMTHWLTACYLWKTLSNDGDKSNC
jgi:hypothetical protein